MAPGTEFAERFSELKDRQNTEGWKELSNIINGLIGNDQSLKGDLAHLFLHFHSDSAVRKLSTKGTVEALQDFQEALLEVSEYATTEVKNAQSMRKFILRESNGIAAGLAYVNFVLFLVGASLTDEQKFFSHFTFQEVGGMKILISSLYEVMKSDEPSVSGLVKAAQTFAQLRPSKKTIRHDLGGMMELGSHNPVSLWSVIFRKTAAEVTAYTSRPSLEKHYVCYRRSSYLGQDRIVKSFLVLQSPGSVREHFAFKVYYKSGSDQVRKSAGALINLGNVVSCFGSSRMLMPGDELGGLQGDGNHILGPKTMTLDIASLTSNDVIVPGHLLTVNEHRDIISCRVICVRTQFTHSGDVDIGSFEVNKYDDDLGQYTEFGQISATADNIEVRDRIWTHISSQLCTDERQRVCTSLTQRDMDLRAMI